MTSAALALLAMPNREAEQFVDMTQDSNMAIQSDH
jgi:hypothetical protein